jgi:hypothetical protein
VVVHYFINNAKRLNNIGQIKTDKIAIVDRDRIVCENINTYAEGGEVTDACIEEVVNIFNSIQRIRDWFITDGKLVIVFEDELMTFSVEQMNYNLEQFTECHDVVEPEVNLNYGEDYKSIYINLKKDDMTIGKYADGGWVENKMELYHGGNLDEYNDVIAQKSGRYEYGAGLYLTSHLETALKYAKGSRKLYKITIRKGKDIHDATIEFDKINEFIKKYVISSKRKEIVERVEKYNVDGKIKAYILNNIILNEKAVTPSNTKYLRNFLIENGIDYEIVDNPYGWGETMVVLYNMDKIVNVEKLDRSKLYADGGTMDVRMEDTVQRMDDPNFADISYYKKGGELKGLTDTQIDTKVHAISRKFKVPIDYIQSELKHGLKFEMEHTKDKSIASKIVLDHLEESPYYYQKLAEMEKELEKMNADEYLPRIQRAYANGGTIDMIYKLNTPTKEPTKLNYIQQVLVRTSEFKAWFGDWEKCAENFLADKKENFKKHYKDCSMVIDLVTLEPQVVYHGSNNKDEFYQFDVTKEQGIGRPYGYFADNIEYSKNFVASSQRGQHGKELLYNCFLNIRNPFMAIDELFYNEKQGSFHWILAIAKRLALDKYGMVDGDKAVEYTNIVTSQIGNYVHSIYEYDDKKPFWLLMAKDVNKEFKYFLMSHGYDGVRYAEEFQSNYDVDNPAEFTKAWTIFDANQVKLADGRNIDFNPMTKDIRFEKGGDTNVHNNIENTEVMENNMSKAQQMRATLGIDKFAEGGHVKGDGKKTNDAKDGGFFEGRSHAEGGIKAVNKDTGQLIEVEGNEVIINKRSVADQTKREFEGKMMTNREILSKINEMGGGVKFEDGGELNEKNCKCIGKKYKFGGNLLSDYDIVKELTKATNIVTQPISDSVDYVDDLIKRVYGRK